MPHIEIAAEKLFSVLGFPITNTLINTWIVVGLLIAVSFVISRRAALVPGGFQNFFEIIVEKFLDMLEGMVGSRRKAELYVPIVVTFFVFILFSNWLGIFPGVGTVGLKEIVDGKMKLVPFFRSAASDLNVTIALGTVAVFAVNVMGMTARGIGTHLRKFFNFSNPIHTFVGLLELISEFARIISFSFRLFGNIFAGEVLLIIVGFLAPFGAPLPFLMLEIFVGFVQALVFAMLTMVFISIAVAQEGHH